MRTRVVAVLSLAALGAWGCAHPPRLDVPKANHQRELGAGLAGEDERELKGELHGEVRSFADCASKAGPGDAIDVKLGPGLYVIDKEIVVRGASLVIRGPGADRTRIKLDSDSLETLRIEDCPSFELRGVSVVGYSGGGISVRRCPRVVVNECDFAGSRYGLDLGSSTAIVDSCCFAGCERAIYLADAATSLTVRATSFGDGWWSIDGSGRVDAFGCAFEGNENGARLRSVPGTRFRSCLFGRYENLNVRGPVDVTSSLLFDDLLERFDGRSEASGNRAFRDREQFPDALPDGIPPGSNLGAIHYALERARVRGEARVDEGLKQTLESEARVYAAAARKAVAAKDRGAASELVRIALDYARAVGVDQDAALIREIESIAR